MSAWLVRQQGSPNAISVPSAAAVVEGLGDGNWLPTDEVKGPADANWQFIESHPTFAEAAEDFEPPKPEVDDTHLDMNPLIDVCLVLLIFFILTITYASLERSIAIPPGNPEDQGPTTKDFKDIRNEVFVVTARLEGEGDAERVVVRIEKQEVPLENVVAEMKKVIEATGRKKMVLYADTEVSWGVFTAILDAAKGNGVNEIIRTSKLGSGKS